MNLRVTRGTLKEYGDLQSGARFFSVSQVLKVLDPDAFSGISKDVLDRASERGRVVHRLFALMLAAQKFPTQYQMPPEPEDVELSGFYKALRQFIDDYNPDPKLVEASDASTEHGYAGTVDTLSFLSVGNHIGLLDLKTGVRRRSHRVQVQAYGKLPLFRPAEELYNLYVRNNGKYELVVVDPSVSDWAWFLSGLGVLKGRLNP